MNETGKPSSGPDNLKAARQRDHTHHDEGGGRATAEASANDIAAFRNAALVRALGEIVYEWRPLTNELVWDGDYTRILGYTREEIGNNTESWTSRVHPDDLKRVLDEVKTQPGSGGCSTWNTGSGTRTAVIAGCMTGA